MRSFHVSSLRVLTGLAALLLVTASAANASATDLTPDPAGGDPNGAPPPPPPMPEPGTVGSATPPPPAGSTAAALDQASAQDTGVGLHFVYIQPEIGLGLASIPKSLTGGSDTGTPAGPAFGLGAGVELITFQLGGRLRALTTPQYNLWTAGGEFAYQPGSGRFWPRFGLTVGYAWAAKLNTDVCGAACDLVSINGIDVGARAGFQYYVSSNIEVGLDGTLDALFLKSKGLGGNPQFSSDQSGTGFMATALAHIGFHYP